MVVGTKDKDGGHRIGKRDWPGDVAVKAISSVRIGHVRTVPIDRGCCCQRRNSLPDWDWRQCDE
jgi:hypothetical protein